MASRGDQRKQKVIDSPGYCIINLLLEIRDKHGDKFSILTEVEEEQAALERIREFEYQREYDEDAKPSYEKQFEGIEQDSVTNWFTTQYNHFSLLSTARKKKNSLYSIEQEKHHNKEIKTSVFGLLNYDATMGDEDNGKLSSPRRMA